MSEAAVLAAASYFGCIPFVEVYVVTENKHAEVAANALVQLTVTEAAAAIRDGSMSSETYASALLERAKSFAELNSFITIDEAAVLSSAREADAARAAGGKGLLLGVPLGIKDSYLTKGMRTTIGVDACENFVPTRDAATVTAIKQAGGIVFGKNNLVEMSYGLTGNNGPFGQVRNPINPAHVPGGSSSGAGASVGAGIVPAAMSGDTVGSIRVPASLCGVVGYKPTTGRWPGEGVAPISHTLDTTGVIARSVEDCALMDQVITGESSLTGEVRSDLKGVKIAYAPRQYLDVVDPEVHHVFQRSLLQMKAAGAEIIEVDLGDDFASLALSATWSTFFRETRRDIVDFLNKQEIGVSFEQIHKTMRDQIKGAWDQFALPDAPGYLSDGDFAKTLDVDLPELRLRMESVFAQKGANLLLFPTTPCPAPLINEQVKFKIGDKDVDFMILAKNTVPTSGAGLPGISIPVGLTSTGLPIGLEIDGARNSDRQLLGLAQRVHKVLGFVPTLP